MRMRMRWLGLSTAVMLAGCMAVGGETPQRIERTHPAAGITRVVLRAADAQTAKVEAKVGAEVVSVSGLPRGGAGGYHPVDKNWKETSAQDWGLDFVFATFGTTLVVSTKNQLLYIEHAYGLDALEVRVPPGIEVVRETRQLNGNGAPDLREPGAGAPPKPPL